MVQNEPASNVIAFAGNTMVYESVKRFALKGLNDLIRVLMENVDDALFELSEKVDNDRDRTMYFDAMRSIRLKRQDIVEKFDENLQQSFGALIQNSQAPAQNDDLGELSLVDQDEVEGQLAIDTMISKARPSFEDDLYAVVERLKEILHRKTIAEDLNPLDPKAICEGFHRAASQLDADIQVKLILYKLFDKFVMSNLGHFYRELNDYFIQKGVLPDLKASKERLQQSSRHMANRIKRSNEPAAQGQTDSLKNDQIDDGNILAMLQRVLSPSSSAPVGMPASNRNSGNLSAAPEMDVSQQLGMSGSATQASIPSASVTALTQLQTENLQIVAPSSADPQQVKSQLHNQLIEFKQQNHQQVSEVDNQIIDIISMLFDFFFDDEALPDPIKVLIGRLQIPILKVAILDNSFFNQKKHPARKLLDSISKASLGWSRGGHQEQILVDKIEQIVEFLLSEFEQDIGVFDQALNDFQQFLADEQDNVEQNLEQIREQEVAREKQLEQARQSVDHLLHKLESKGDFSFPVTSFLHGIWKTVLLNTLIARGIESNEWRNLKKISSTLIWTLIPKHSEEERTKLLKTLPPLLRALSKGMELVQIEQQRQNEVFQMLVAEHSHIVKKTSKNIVTRVDDKTVWPEKNMADALAGFNATQMEDEAVDFLLTEDATGEIRIIDNSDLDPESDAVYEITQSSTQDVIRNLEDFTQSIVNGNIFIDEEIVMDSTLDATGDEDMDDFVDQVKAMELGTWIEFDDEEASLHAKLSWKSNVTGKYVFVNRLGQKVKNLTTNGLAMELRAGRAKLVESISVFDRAIHSLVSTLRH